MKHCKSQYSERVAKQSANSQTHSSISNTSSIMHAKRIITEEKNADSLVLPSECRAVKFHSIVSFKMMAMCAYNHIRYQKSIQNFRGTISKQSQALNFCFAIFFFTLFLTLWNFDTAAIFSNSVSTICRYIFCSLRKLLKNTRVLLYFVYVCVCVYSEYSSVYFDFILSMLPTFPFGYAM